MNEAGPDFGLAVLRAGFVPWTFGDLVADPLGLRQAFADLRLDVEELGALAGEALAEAGAKLAARGDGRPA